MGDRPESTQPQGNLPTTPSGSRSSIPVQPSLGSEEVLDNFKDQHGYLFQSPPQTQSPFHSQLQQQFYPQYQSRQNVQPSAHANMSYPQASARDSPFNMTSMGSALPESNFAQSYQQPSPQRFSRVSTTPGAYQLPQQNSQYLSQSTMTQPVNSAFSVQYSPQYQGTFSLPQQASPQLQQPGLAPQFFSSQNYMVPPPQQAQQFYYPSGQFTSQNQAYPSSSLRAYPSQLGVGNPTLDTGMGREQTGSEQLSVIGADSSGLQGRAGSASSSAGGPSIPRGPPRKPRQSGHALWVGNLPPGANVVDLKEHFSRDATEEILSVFLISKSNCAFVNYRTEESCAAAMSRFHDSRFQGVRLVCRLRRSSVNTVTGVPTGPAALSASQNSTKEALREAEVPQQQVNFGTDTKDSSEPKSQAKDRYFIVKSLTVEDLELSVRNGIWATQSHNEEVLNQAFEDSESVYLIFSANKSGEYFGCARMVSSINNDPDAAIEFAPKATSVEDPDLPKAIPTAATESAPKGRIIDDSARGTIFWEVESEETEVAVETENLASDHSDQEGDDNPSKAWGKPFKIEWQSTNRLPFYRTRGLRNPWNSNREVKIARDGTELETSIGRRLVQMFHREPSPSSQSMPSINMQMPPMMGGYPHMRPY